MSKQKLMIVEFLTNDLILRTGRRSGKGKNRSFYMIDEKY